MKSTALTGLFAMLALAGCQTSVDTADVSSPSFRPDRRQSVEITPVNVEFERRRTQVRATAATPGMAGPVEGDIIELPKFVVTEKGFVQFGLSVVTNAEVKRGGRITWMRVGLVIPGSLAARNKLDTWDQILALDGVIVTELDREGMLRALFQKHSGERLTLHILARRHGMLPAVVRLVHQP